jgi:hypothetical protein
MQSVLASDASFGTIRSRFCVQITEGSASYFVDFRFGPKRRRRVVLDPISQSTLANARDRARATLVGARRGEDLTVNPRKGEPAFAEVWRTMIDEIDKPKLSAATIKDYEDRARRLILLRLGTKRIGDVTAADVDKAVAAATGNRNRAYVATLIKKTINHGKRARLLPDDHRNPAADVAVKRWPKKGRALEIGDVARFGAALAGMEAEGKVSPWLANLLRLSLVCGLRPGEVRTLEWSRVNLPRRKMTVVVKTGARETIRDYHRKGITEMQDSNARFAVQIDAAAKRLSEDGHSDPLGKASESVLEDHV